LGSAAPIASAVGAGPATGAVTALRCLQGNTPLLAAWSVAGLLLVILLAALLYAVHPWFESRSGWRRRLPTLSPAEHPDITACLAELAVQLGMSRRERPTVLVDPHTRRADARTFGWQRRSWLRVTAGLLIDFTRRPAVFRGILLHELAHVRNRDNRATNLTVATWRAFVGVVLLPYLVGLVAPGVFGGTTGWQWPNPRLLATIVVLTVLVYLTKAAVLRARETHADAVAYQHDHADSLRTEILAADTDERWVFIRNHFPPARRRAMLGDPTALAAPDGLSMFGAGVAVSLLMVNVLILGWWSLLAATGVGKTVSAMAIRVALGAPRGPWDSWLLIFLSYGPIALLVAVVVAGLAGVTGWRAGPLTRHGHGPVRTWRSAVPLTLGMMLGVPLSAAYADARTWGVFDTSIGNDVRDVVVTALALLLIVTAVFRWSAECAIAWLTDDGGGSRRLWMLTVVLGTMASLPFFLIWSVVQDNAAIGLLSVPTQLLPPVAGWPAATVVLAQYLPLNALDALPGAIVLYGLAGAFPLLGAIRRRTADRRAMWLAPVGAAVAVVVPLGLAILLHAVAPGDMVRLARTVPGVSLYLLSGIILLIAVIAALAGV
ncbi:MAG TPA: M48 family metalloprotease, partial [Pseudonocardiaceae bacterium]